MEDLVTFLITSITGNKDFTVSQTEEEGRVILTVKTKPEIIGLIIGKGGKMIKNIRRIVGIKAVLLKKRVDIEVVEA